MQQVLYPDFSVVIVDDEEHVLKSLTSILQSHGINNIVTIQDSLRVMQHLKQSEAEVILLDLTMPHLSGEALLDRIRDSFPQIPVIIVTGMNDLSKAVQCMQAGAFDYMVKAVEESRLISGVQRAIEIRRLRRQYGDLRTKLLDNSLQFPEAFSHIISQNRKMQSIFLFVESIADSTEPVLITGETGVGKNLIARALHEVSKRSGSFVEVNIAGLDDTMLTDTLFGHRKGAFTGAATSRDGLIEQAKAGTLFLDEIGDLSLPSQIKLLRLLDTREYYPLGSDLSKRTDARVVVATNRNLEALVAAEKFRKDLFYRLATHSMMIPPLRERKDDLALLLGFFLKEASLNLGKGTLTVPQELLPLLQTYHFPGNIRELRSMVYDAVSKQKTNILSLSSFRETMGQRFKTEGERHLGDLIAFGETLPTINQATQLLVEEAMQRAGGNQSIAAGLLGISHQALNKRIRRKKQQPSGQ
jgi:DNA-binding NtrC family response regulator